MIGPISSRRADEGGIHARHAFAHMTLDVFDNYDRVIDHQSDGKHNRQQCQQVEAEPE